MNNSKARLPKGVPGRKMKNIWNSKIFRAFAQTSYRVLGAESNSASDGIKAADCCPLQNFYYNCIYVFLIAICKTFKFCLCENQTLFVKCIYITYMKFTWYEMIVRFFFIPRSSGTGLSQLLKVEMPSLHTYLPSLQTPNPGTSTKLPVFCFVSLKYKVCHWN